MDSARKRNPEKTKQKIYQAALAEFTKHGYGGARVDSIAERAGVNKRMLYHYFGSKDGLFLYVLEQAYDEIRSNEERLELENLSPTAAIEELVIFTVNYFVKHPEFVRLLNNENLYQAEHIKKSRKIRRIHSPFVQLISDVLRRGEQQGVFRKDVDPVQFYITVASVAYFYFSNVHTLSTIFGRNFSKTSEIKRRQEHCKDVILGYLRPL